MIPESGTGSTLGNVDIAKTVEMLIPDSKLHNLSPFRPLLVNRPAIIVLLYIFVVALERAFVDMKRCLVVVVTILQRARFAQSLGIRSDVARRINFWSVASCETPLHSKNGKQQTEVSDGDSNNNPPDSSKAVDLDPSTLASKSALPFSSERSLDLAIDSFLRGEYDRPFAEDAMAPHPGLTPGAMVEAALRSLRKLDDPEPSHGAAVFLRFCAPLSRGERWGGGTTMDPWKNVLRGALTPTMLARRLRASDFSVLLDWTKLDVTDGYSLKKDLIGLPTVAFVNAALYFGEPEPTAGFGTSGTSVVIVQFRLRRIGGVWLIESASRSKRELFLESDE